MDEKIAELGVWAWVGWLALTLAIAALAGWALTEGTKRILVSRRRQKIYSDLLLREALQVGVPARTSAEWTAEIDKLAAIDPPGWTAFLVAVSTVVGVIVGALLGWRLEYSDVVVGALVGLPGGASPGWIVKRIKSRSRALVDTAIERPGS